MTNNRTSILSGISLALMFAATVVLGHAGQNLIDAQVISEPGVSHDLLAPPVPLPKLNQKASQHDSSRPMQAASCTPSPSPTPTPGES